MSTGRWSLDAEVASFAAMLEAGEGPVRLDGDRLVVGRDTGDDLPASVERLKGLVLGVLPEVELTEVVIWLDAACGFSQHLLHSAGAKARSPALLAHLYAAILAQAVAMARARGCPRTRSPTPPPGTCGKRRSWPPSTR